MHTFLIPGEFNEMATAILSNIGDGVISTDLAGKIIYMNHMAEEIVQLNKEETIGRFFDDVFTIYDSETRQALESPVAYVIDQRMQTGLQNNTVLKLENNVEKYISATCTPIYNQERNMVGVVVVFRDITKLKLYELNHINEENNLKLIFDNTPAGMMIVDQNTVVLRVNETIVNYTKKAREDIIGKRFGESVNCIGCYENEAGCGFVERCKTCEVVIAVRDAYNLQKQTVNIEIVMNLIEDNVQIETWYQTSVHPIVINGNSVVAITLVDITKSKLQEIHAKEAKDYVDNILSQLPFTIWMSDENLMFKYINNDQDDIMEAAFSSDPMGNWLEFIHPEDVENFWSSIKFSISEKKEFIQEARVRRKVGGYCWGLIHGIPYYENGKYAGFIGSNYDITNRKETEEDLKRYQDLLISAKEAAETANKAKSEFLANMSHEIRTPINGMVGMIDLTLLTDLNDDQRDNLITSKACANSLIKIVNDVLDFSKLEAGKLTLEIMDFDLKDLIEEIVRTYSSRVFSKGLELNYTFSSTIPRYLVGDPNRLRQVLNNLISNAIKFTEHGEVTLTVKTNKISKDEVELNFTVSDTGIGIAREDLSKLFKSFSQIENTYTKKFGGTGLGLIISKQLVEMMGGQIGIDSELGKGSNFNFNLKYKIGKPILEKKQDLPSIQKADKPLHILLAEDDLINRKVICKMLEEKGHTVKTASNGMEALDCYNNENFDAILMDIQMPIMNGIEATNKIKILENERNRTPVIAMTAYALPGDKERFLDMGMDAYVAKPIQMGELFGLLDQVTTEAKDNIPRKITLSEVGEVIFTFHKPKHLREQHAPVLKEIDNKIKQLTKESEGGNINNIESIANAIKKISNDFDITDIKDSAFKIELAARKGNESEIRKYIDQIIDEFKIYQNSIE